MKSPQKRKRKRRIPYIFSSDRLDERFWQLLDDPDCQLRAYVYRMLNDRKVLPALFAGEPFRDLSDWLRHYHSGGEFHVIIRRGKRMELSGIICIGVPMDFRSSR
jgi:hypothetical protein